MVMFKYLFIIILIFFNSLFATNIKNEIDKEWEENNVYYEIQNGVVEYLIVYSQETFTEKFHSKNGAVRQSRRTTINKHINEYNIFDNIRSVYPRDHKIMYKKLINILKKGNTLKIDENKFYNLVYENGIYDKTVHKINDLAYYYSKTINSNIDLLIKVYKDILSLYPNRTVAYINIGDAYLKNGNKQKAIKNYKIYVKQMKEKNKEKKIPKRVLKILDNSETSIKTMNKQKNTSKIEAIKKEEKTFFTKLLELFGSSIPTKNIMQS